MTTPPIRYVDLDGAAPDPDGAVVVVDVLRAFTVQPWLFARGARRVLAVADADDALALRDRLPDVVTAGEEGGERIAGFDLGNSPAEVATLDLHGRTVVHRTSAGTQGLARTIGSRLVLAASFVTARASAEALLAAAPQRVTFVVTGASHGRDGDEDLACAELIAAWVGLGRDTALGRGTGSGRDTALGRGAPDPTPFLARVATSDAGRNFTPGGPAWASPEDLAMAVDLDRFDHALAATPAMGLDGPIEGAIDVSVAR